MTDAASGALVVAQVLNDLARKDRGRLLSALIARVRDFSLAEDALQDAMISAVSHWSRTGVPSAPHAWLLQVAWRKAIDRIRQGQSQARLASDIAKLASAEAAEDEPDMIPDERLRLIFTCCHPAIEPKSQVALTLRTLGGLTTGQIARAFLDQEATMGQRLSRAKGKIAAAGIRYAVPEPDEWPARLASVLTVIYLIFNAGYSAGSLDGQISSGQSLAEEAIWLAGLLDTLSPGDPEIEGLRALMLLTHARHAARLGSDGATLSLVQQDRNLWDRTAIEAGSALIEHALSRGRPGPYQIKAAIAACHCEGETSDWAQIMALYDLLLIYEPTSVVRLNRAVAMAEAGALKAGLSELESLSGELRDYQPYHAARAEFLARLGRTDEAIAAYQHAISSAASQADALYLECRLKQICGLGMSPSDLTNAETAALPGEAMGSYLHKE